MYTFLIILFIIICILMVVAILLQASKGGGLASSFGGMGGAGGFLGARTAISFLQKVTVGLAIGYGVLCLVISLMSTPGELPQSETQEKIQQEQQTIPPSPVPLPDPGENSQTPQQPAPEPNE
jgi:preprotein translocase subunit SecG